MRYITKTDLYTLCRTICEALRAARLISNDDYTYDGRGGQSMYRYFGIKIDLNCHHPAFNLYAPDNVKRARELQIIEVVEQVLKVAGVYTDGIKVRFTDSPYKRSELSVLCRNNRVKVTSVQ